MLRAILTGMAVGLVTAGGVVGMAAYGFTPDLAIADSGPRSIRLEHSWAGTGPFIDIKSSLRVGSGSGYEGETEIQVGVPGPSAPIARRNGRIDGALLKRLETVIREVRLRRLPYRPSYEWTDDYPSSLLRVSTRDGSARFEMLSQERADWMVLVNERGIMTMYSTHSEPLAELFQQLLDALSQPELDRMRREHGARFNRLVARHKRDLSSPGSLPEALVRLAAPDPNDAIGTAILEEPSNNFVTFHLPDGIWSRRHEKRLLATPDKFVVPLVGPVAWPAVFHVDHERLWVWSEGEWGYLERRSAGLVRFGDGGDEAFNAKWSTRDEATRP